MENRQRIIALIAGVLVLVILGWAIYEIVHTPASDDQANLTSQSASQSPAKPKKSKTTAPSTEAPQTPVQAPATPNTSASTPANNQSDTNLADTGSGEVFALAAGVGLTAAVLHRAYVRKRQSL